MSREYSGTPPYGHLVNTVTLLLQPLFLAAQAKSHMHFFVKKPSLIQPIFFWPLGDRKKGVPLYEFSASYSSLLWIVCCS